MEERNCKTTRERERERQAQRDREQGIDQHVFWIGCYGKNPASVESWNMAYFGKHGQATNYYYSVGT